MEGFIWYLRSIVVLVVACLLQPGGAAYQSLSERCILKSYSKYVISLQQSISFNATPYPFVTKDTNVTLSCSGRVVDLVSMPANQPYMTKVEFRKNKRRFHSCRVGSYKRLRSLSCSVIVTGISANDSFVCIVRATRGPCNAAQITFVVENNFTTSSIKLQTVNTLGIGKSTDPVTATTQKQEFPTQVQTYGGKPGDGSLNSGAIVGVIVGAVLLLILVYVLLLFVRRRLLRKQHDRSVREFEKLYLTRSCNPDSVDIKTPEEPEPDFSAELLAGKTDVLDELPYVVLLKDWEIAPYTLKLLDKKLGEGKFGIVKQGLFASGEIVAVKTVKDVSSESDLLDLMSELKILKEINEVPHPNVIRLIGGCSIAGKLHVVMEFCPGGNLHKFLINSRVNYSIENSSDYINLASTLNHRQLLKIAADISSGMVHLSSQKFVHRDLAARNILIGEDNVAKVSDFGLARDVSGVEEYIRSNQNLLPVKWMALESLLYGRFTTASDVWSYGILLHEIATLGAEPYKNISPYNIVTHVGSGCRMQQPPQCSDEVYEIMKNCWNVEPTKRPSFEDIHNTVREMLVDNEKSYINLLHVVDEGPLTSTTKPTNSSIKGETAC